MRKRKSDFSLWDRLPSKRFKKRIINQIDLDTASNIMMLNKYENIVILWYDDQLDQEIKDKLENLHNHIILCSTIDIFKQSIYNYQNSKIIVIVSGRYSSMTLQLFHDNNTIDSFYIFCIADNKYVDLKKTYSKLIGIYTSYDYLFQILKKQIRSLLQHLSIFKLFNENNKSFRDLEQEGIDYSWYQLLRDALMYMTHVETSKNEMLQYCRSYFHGDALRLKQIEDFERTYQSTDAIQWYTKNHFPFDFVNKALRTEDVEALYNLRYFITDLCQGLKQIFNENFSIYKESMIENIVVYRGLTLPDKDIEQLKNSIGKYVSTNGFLSTSLSQSVAEMFATNVLFKIEIDCSMKNMIYADISEKSVNRDEEEVLFDLGSLFQITNVHFCGKKWIITMIGVNNVEYVENTLVNFSRNSMIENTIFMPDIYYGRFLFMVGHYSKCIEYTKNLLQQQLINDKFDKYYILKILSGAYSNNKQDDLALKYELDAYNMRENDKEFDCSSILFSICTNLQAIGEIYANKGDHDNAAKYYEKALLKISDYSNTDNLVFIADLHNSLGHLYFRQKNFLYAFKHCQQSLEFDYKEVEVFPEVHETLAQIYFEMNNNNNEVALKHLDIACNYIQKYFPKNHLRLRKIYIWFALIYFDMNQYDLCIEYCEKLLKIQIINDYETSTMVYRMLGLSYMIRKRFNEALKYYNKLLEIQEQHKNLFEIDDNDRMDNARMNANIGQCYFLTKQYDFALKFYSTAIDTYEQHIQSIDTFNDDTVLDDINHIYVNMASIYYDYDEYTPCIMYYKKTLTILTKRVNLTVDDDKNQTANLNYMIGFCYDRLGFCYSQKEEFKLSTDYYEYALSIKEYMSDKKFDDTEISKLYYQIAFSYEQEQKYKKAIQYYTKSLEINEKNVSDNYMDIIDLCDCLGRCGDANEQCNLCIKYYLKASMILENNQRPQDETKKAILNNEIGWYYGLIGNYDLALEYCMKSLAFFENNQAFDNTIHKANVLSSLGVIYCMKNDYDQAWTYCRHSQKILFEMTSLSIFHLNGWNYKTLADIYCHYNEKTLALNCYKRALENFKKADPIVRRNIKQTGRLLALILSNKM